MTCNLTRITRQWRKSSLVEFTKVPGNCYQIRQKHRTRSNSQLIFTADILPYNGVEIFREVVDSVK